jgi:hypothetical protein
MNRREALAALTSLPIIAASKVEVKSNDVIVVEVAKDVLISQEEAEYLKTKIGEIWPNNRIVCLRGCSLKVVNGGTV